MSEEPVFITLCDADNPRVQPLYSSLQGNLHILENYSPRLGFLSKIFKVHEFLASDTDIADDQIIVFTDAYDVLCIRYDPARLVDDFKAEDKDLILGAETVFAHHSSDVLPFFLTNYLGKPAKYLNAGFVMGYKWAYFRMLNYIVDNFVEKYMMDSRQNDQRVISRFMLENIELGLLNMDIDSTFKFCYTHTYDNNPLYPDKLTSYFVHVTWMALEIQKQAYDEIRRIFNI
ncbi:MAG: glycosyltransferase domain-containing protein [Cyanobacteria bacterium J06592_8]